MLQLIFWTVATGFVWCLVGVIYALAPSDKQKFYSFYLAYSIVYMVSSAFLIHPRPVSASELLKVAVFISAFSLINMLGFVYLKKAMERGSQGIAWCIAQSAVVVPFLGSTFFLGSQTGAFQWLGMGILAVSLAVLGKAKPAAGSLRQDGYFQYTALAFGLIGVSQFLQMIPGNIGCSEAALDWRVFIGTPANVLWWTAACIAQKSFQLKSVWKQSLLYGVVIMLGQFIFYHAVDVGDACRMTAVVYPIAIGSSIVLFSLYCAIFRHEKLSPASVIGTLLNVAGIVLLSLK